MTDFEPVVALPQWLKHGIRRLRTTLSSGRGRMLLAGAALGGLTVVLVVAELRTSWSQARVLATVSRAMTFEASGETGPGIVSPP